MKRTNTLNRRPHFSGFELWHMLDDVKHNSISLHLLQPLLPGQPFYFGSDFILLVKKRLQYFKLCGWKLCKYDFWAANTVLQRKKSNETEAFYCTCCHKLVIVHRSAALLWALCCRRFPRRCSITLNETKYLCACTRRRCGLCCFKTNKFNKPRMSLFHPSLPWLSH